jgi:FlaA1/EpsC-like NDP-sugar epimerase
MAAVLNNIYGTRNIAEAAGGHGAERFVMISTNKAVNPTSVMGATKQVAEKVVHVMNDRYATKYITVRFGNVLGSRGSVVPLFRRQLAAGGPLTVTDPKMTRYFMTIPEASQLVLQAGSMGQGGEVFLLEMGEPVKIIDLARNMIRLSGYEPEVDIPIQITGVRPGEKLYEELLTQAEGTRKTNHEKIFTAQLEEVEETWLHQQIDSFQQCQTEEEVIHVLQRIIPTYHPNHDPE